MVTLLLTLFESLLLLQQSARKQKAKPLLFVSVSVVGAQHSIKNHFQRSGRKIRHVSLELFSPRLSSMQLQQSLKT